MAGPAGAGSVEPLRRPVKQQGRAVASDELRARCFARVREGREALINKLRCLADDQGGCPAGALRTIARGVLQEEAMPGVLLADLNNNDETWLDHEAMLALEEEILQELTMQAELQEINEVERMLDAQNEEDCALYEQHLLEGVPCPLCGLGRLLKAAGELRCGSCSEMKATLMDEALPLDDVSEMLGFAEDRHRQAGCTAAGGSFEVRHDFGAPLLFFNCKACGWREVAL
ncbi:unnamed protein product [Polarella glacialis]|uniref:RPA-interacting protein C-terminal domain-containing protein n=1 Tax=Polarella glacialis TaxID=89957 RepID=A0A813JJQ8_POLGL|nr:unnamed protein product [Polarella glacialis]|mmetsp:Transcript_11691/g.18655  ORF Transcript_11691/g.18655 Transcript_11691/m.18655 type:complete len:231 (+) Transcript_11691:57-749(+)